MWPRPGAGATCNACNPLEDMQCLAQSAPHAGRGHASPAAGSTRSRRNMSSAAPAAATSSGSTCSSGEWLTPPRLRTNSIATCRRAAAVPRWVLAGARTAGTPATHARLCSAAQARCSCGGPARCSGRNGAAAGRALRERPGVSASRVLPVQLGACAAEGHALWERSGVSASRARPGRLGARA